MQTDSYILRALDAQAGPVPHGWTHTATRRGIRADFDPSTLSVRADGIPTVAARFHRLGAASRSAVVGLDGSGVPDDFDARSIAREHVAAAVIAAGPNVALRAAPCTRCNGTRVDSCYCRAGFSALAGGPCPTCNGTGTRRCRTCDPSPRYPNAADGSGTFAPVDVSGLIAAVRVTRGPNRGRLLASRPARKLGTRAYFVWRMLRFHVGADVRMPVAADLDVSGDPWRPVLDVLAESMAGRRSVGLDRWAHAFGVA